MKIFASTILLLVFSVLKTWSQSFDASVKLKQCLKDGNDRDYCTEQIMEDFRPIMKDGVPELELPPLDPLSVPKIDFKFFEATVEFKESVLKGFQGMIINYSKIDPVRKTWKISVTLPTFNANGQYALYGTIPPNLDLDRSEGAGRLSGRNAQLAIDMDIDARNNGKLQITSFDLKLELDDIKAELECLFPRNGRCCPRKYLKSCNTILAKTVLRFINSDGKNFIKNFQPEITRQVEPLLKFYLNTAIRNVDASDVINV